jgi:hypothetical protein
MSPAPRISRPAAGAESPDREPPGQASPDGGPLDHGRVARRHVLYLQGYDPRGLAQYYRMFRTELRKFATLHGVTTRVGRPAAHDDAAIASWQIDTEGDGWRTTAQYDFLRWEEMIQQDLARPMWRTIAQATGYYVMLLADGTLAKFARAHWRFAIFISYAFVMLALEALVALAGGIGFGAALRHVAAPWPIALAGGGALAALLLSLMLRGLEKRTYVLYLMSDWIFTWEYAHGRRPEWHARIDRFARYLVETVQGSDADEFVVVGHSSGSFLGLEVLSRALDIDPALGRRGPRIVFLTLGGNLPIVGFLPVSADFRDRLRRLAAEPSVNWIDFQSRKDVMNFYPFDPVAGHGLDLGAARCNPRIVNVRFRDLIAPENYAAFRRDFFRVHFQFVRANERRADYDFFLMMCGPDPVGAAAAKTATAR